MCTVDWVCSSPSPSAICRALTYMAGAQIPPSFFPRNPATHFGDHPGDLVFDWVFDWEGCVFDWVSIGPTTVCSPPDVYPQGANPDVFLQAANLGVGGWCSRNVLGVFWGVFRGEET